MSILGIGSSKGRGAGIYCPPTTPGLKKLRKFQLFIISFKCSIFNYSFLNTPGYSVKIVINSLNINL
jgi:hypothetical protein